MAEKKNKNQVFALAIGVGIGMILYKVIFDVLWPMFFN